MLNCFTFIDSISTTALPNRAKITISISLIKSGSNKSNFPNIRVGGNLSGFQFLARMSGESEQFR